MNAPQPDFTGLIITVVRALASLLGAGAAIAALLTQTAFEDRPVPLEGIFKGSPFERQKLTPWGRRLLVVIVAAAVVQFVADFAKDKADDAQVKATTADITSTVANATSAARTEIVNKVTSVADSELGAENAILDDQGALANSASANLQAAHQTFNQTQRLMQPISAVSLEYMIKLPSGYFDVDRYLNDLKGSLNLINTLGGPKGAAAWATERAGFDLPDGGSWPVRSISITSRSAFFAQRDPAGNFKYNFMGQFNTTLLHLELFKNQAEASDKLAEMEKYSNACGMRGDMDVSVNVYESGSYRYQYALDTPSEIVVDLVRDNVNTYDVRKDEQILSFPDLSQAVAVMTIDWGANAPKLSKAAVPQLSRMILSVRGHIFSFTANTIKFVNIDPGCSVFLIRPFREADGARAKGRG